MSAPATLAPQSTPSAPESSTRRLGLWLDVTLVVGLMALTTSLLVAFRREPVYSDDLGYWNRWERVGQSTGMANHYRIAMVASAQLSRLVFGESMAAYNAVGIVYGAGLIAVLYVLVRLLFPRPVALGASLLLLTSPVFLEDATLLLPDWPAMFWFVSGLALLVVAATRVEQLWKSNLVAAAAGLSFFLSLWVKEGVAPLFLAIPICAFLVARGWRAVRVTGIAAGASVVFAVLELGLLKILFDNPLRRLDVVLGGHVGRRTSTALGGQVESSSNGGGAGAGSGSETTWADLAGRYLERLETVSSAHWVLVFLALALVVLLIARQSRLWFLAVPTVIGLGFAVFGVGSIDPLVPLLSMKLRYLSIGWVFLVALVAATVWVVLHWTALGVAKLLEAPARVAHGAAASILLVLVAVVSFNGVSDVAERPVFVRNGEDGLLQIATAVEEMRAEGVPLNKIIADGRSLTGLHIQLPDSEKPLLDGATSDFTRAEPGDIVVVNRKRIGQNRWRGAGEELAEDVLIPPPNWRRIGDTAIQDFRIYYVEDESAAVAAPPPLTTAGTDLTALARARLLGDDPGHLEQEETEHGLVLHLEGAESLRMILGEGSHNRGPDGDDAHLLQITERGRLGVRVEIHIDRDVELEAFRLRTFAADGSRIENSRMYRVTEEDRVSTAAAPIEGDSVSFADSIEVDPAQDVSFRVVGFFNGTGTVTVDRISVELIPVAE